jgi:hypothetical protein
MVLAADCPPGDLALSSVDTRSGHRRPEPKEAIMPAVRKALWAAALAALVTPETLGATAALAAPAAPAGPAATIEVVATGLNAPRGLLYDPHRQRVLVAEAGVEAGNTGPCGFAERGLFMCLGHTGSVLEYRESDGIARRIITGLPSTALQEGPTVVIGLHDLALRNRQLIGAFGTLGNQPYRESLEPGGALLGQVVHLKQNGRHRPLGDIVGFIDNRYPGHIEANPYGLLIDQPTTIFVANAGGPGGELGNNLLAVHRNGTVAELAQFPERPAAADPEVLVRAVPTAVARGPDGALYVGELSGAPFFPGEARVWRVVPGHPPTVHAQGFTTIIDLAFDHLGRLIVLQTGPDPFDATLAGALIRVEPDGQRTVLASAGLTNPGGVAVAGPGRFYLTSGLATGGDAGTLLRLRVSG